MEFKNLIGKANQNDKESKKFLAIEIGSEVVKSAVWQVVDKKTKVVSVGTIEEWKSDSLEDLITAVDVSVSKALESVDPEPNEVIYGLPESWVDEGGISESKKPMLKTLSSKFDFKPVGFVVTTEALVHYLREIEGGPPSTILIFLSETEVGVVVVRLGNIEGSKIVGRSEDLCQDVEEGLARFGSLENLPSRMLIFDGNLDLEAAKQQLISYDWQAKLSFLHFPKIENLDNDVTVKAVAIAGGGEVARSLGIEVDEENKDSEESVDNKDKNVDVGEINKDIVAGDVGKRKEKNDDKNDDDVLNGDKLNDGRDSKKFKESGGEGEGRDLNISRKVNKDGSVGKNEKKIIMASEIGDKSREFGFGLEDKAEKKESKGVGKRGEKTLAFNKEVEGSFNSGKEDDLDELKEVDKKKKFRLRPKMSGFIQKFAKFKNLFFVKKLITKMPKIGFLPPMVLVGLGILLITFIGGFIAYWNLPKAKVSIYVKPKVIEKEASFTLDEDIQVIDIEKKLIPAKEESVEVEGEKEIETTGEGLVGEKSSGKVTIFNRTQSEKTFDVGTELSVDGYKFLLDEEIKIASASTQENSDFSTTIIPAKVDVNVTAAGIGDDYNYSGGTQFSVESFATSSFVAQAISDFSGGFSQTVRMVSQEDLERVKEELLTKLKEEAVSKLSVESNSKQGVVEVEVEEVVEEKYSGEEGDESDTLKLFMKLKLPIFTYDVGELSLLMDKEYGNDIPDNYLMSKDNFDMEVLKAVSDDEGKVDVLAKVKLKLIPEIDTSEVIGNIKGKYPPLTEDYFSSLANFSKVETEFSLSLPSRLKTFPRKESNITIDINLEDD